MNREYKKSIIMLLCIIMFSGGAITDKIIINTVDKHNTINCAECGEVFIKNKEGNKFYCHICIGYIDCKYNYNLE